MAFREAGRGPSLLPLPTVESNISPCYNFFPSGKRRIDDFDGSNILQDQSFYKRIKLSELSSTSQDGLQLSFKPCQVNTPAFFVVKERQRSLSPLTACAMERTESGLSISSDTAIYSTSSHDDDQLLHDAHAASLVRERLMRFRRTKDSQPERILRTLIQPRSREAEYTLDQEAMESIFSAANEIFFHNRLSQRVTWDWSHSSSPQYTNHIIGTTALRRSKLGGYETLIVLSSPILKDKKYNRRLLISTFLHELIHSYLFICCGFKARECGGHTKGFREIAALIDEWAGPHTLHLRDMEADLDHFREDEEEQPAETPRRAYPLHHPLPEDYDYVTPYHPHHHNQSQQAQYQQFDYSHHEIPAPRGQELFEGYQHNQDAWDYWVDDRREHFTLSQCSTPRSSTPMTFDAERDPPMETIEFRDTHLRLSLRDDRSPPKHIHRRRPQQQAGFPTHRRDEDEAWTDPPRSRDCTPNGFGSPYVF